jgi:hypothetical protein
MSYNIRRLTSERAAKWYAIGGLCVFAAMPFVIVLVLLPLYDCAGHSFVRADPAAHKPAENAAFVCRHLGGDQAVVTALIVVTILALTIAVFGACLWAVRKSARK